MFLLFSYLHYKTLTKLILFLVLYGFLIETLIRLPFKYTSLKSITVSKLNYNKAVIILIRFPASLLVRVDIVFSKFNISI